MAKNPHSMSVDLDGDAGTVTVSVKVRDTGEVIDSGVFSVTEIHQNIQPLVGLYGYSKLLQDRSSDTKTGPAKLEAMKAVAEQLAAGNWQKERKVGSPTVSAEVEALARLKKITIPQAQAALRKYDKSQKEQIFANEKIVALAATIRAEREDDVEVSLDELVD